VVVAKVSADPRYHAPALRKGPRKVGSFLALFDCINCDKCLPVCPNDANFVYETPARELDYASFRVEAGQAVPAPGGHFAARKGHQIATFQDFCNECGNCDVFCPEDGGPFVEKPRFFGSLEAWRALPQRDGFYVSHQSDVEAAWGRVGGREYHLEIDRSADRALFTDGVLTVEVRHSERRSLSARARPGAADGHPLDFGAYLAMASAVDGVLDRRRANPVNAAFR
jgi:putative selenate reductase